VSDGLLHHVQQHIPHPAASGQCWITHHILGGESYTAVRIPQDRLFLQTQRVQSDSFPMDSSIVLCVVYVGIF